MSTLDVTVGALFRHFVYLCLSLSLSLVFSGVVG